MRLWHYPARALPVTLRPFGGETIPSYAHRLAQANNLPITAILRTLGDLSPGSGRQLLTMDGILNRPAQDRLETLTQISRTRLIQSLPALTRWHHRPMPTDRPAVYFRKVYPPADPACTRCVQHRATTPALIQLTATTRICRPHRRWLGHRQHDLARLPVVLGAFHRYRRLHSQHEGEDPRWFEDIHRQAFLIAHGWARDTAPRHPNLLHRWNLRAEQLDTDVHAAFTVVTLPEVVALTELMSDLPWRKYLALRHPWSHKDFYRQVACRTGAHERTLAGGSRDPLHAWVAAHHWRFRGTRQRSYDSFFGLDLEIGHFK
jgi:hypothetical protein